MQGCNGPGSCVKGVATVLLAGLLLWGTTGCSSGDPSAEATGGPAAGSDGEVELTGTITVSAASSLSEAFADLAAEFSRLHPGVEAVTNFGSSARLAAQVRGGAPADLVAFADLASVQVLQLGVGVVTSVLLLGVARTVLPPRRALSIPTESPSPPTSW